MERDVNEDILMKLPMWVHERMLYLHKKKDGHVCYYHAIMLPFEYDPITENVEFYAEGIRNFQSQINKYHRGCRRPGIHY